MHAYKRTSYIHAYTHTCARYYTHTHTKRHTYIHTYIHTGANVDAKDNMCVPDVVNGGLVKGATAAFHARAMKRNEWQKVVQLLELYSNEVICV